MTETTHQTTDSDQFPAPNRRQADQDHPTLTGQDIAEAQGALRALLEKNMGKAGTSANAYIVLRVLALRGPTASPSDFHAYLAGQRQLGLDLPGVAALLDGLEADGLISGGAADGPGPVQLTARGTARHTDLAARTIVPTRELFGGLDPEHLAIAHEVLVELTRRAEHVRASI